MIDVSLVIPFLNEEDNLGELVKQLNKYIEAQSFSVEAIFVNDGSTDNSISVLKEIESDVLLKLVCLSRNFGSHAAVRAGLTQATGKFTMFFSADLQEPFTMIGDMYKKACEGYDIIIARKSSAETSFTERLFSNISTSLFKKLAVKDYPKGGANNFLFNTKVKEILCDNVESNSSIHMQIVNLGFKRAIIDVSLVKRHSGKSKWTFFGKVKLFIDSFVAFSYTPIRAISVLGIILFIAGLLYALWIVIVSLTNITELAAGFPTIVSLLLIGFGITNLSLGIIAEYIFRTLDAARNRPVFIIDTVENLSGEEN